MTRAAADIVDPDRPYWPDGVLAHAPDVFDPTPPPYDIIGDVHGCVDELRDLLTLLGYQREGHVARHPEGRTLVFIGDLNDRGPGSVAVWQLLLASRAAGVAAFTPGNHDTKLARYLLGRNVQLTHGLRETLDEFYALPAAERRALGAAIARAMRSSAPYRVFDDGRLVVAHAGLEEWMLGRVDREISSFARYGDPTGEQTWWGAPVRRDWARTYRGAALVVYGHTPVAIPEFRHNTINIDQGCAFGGALTALRYPERELVSVPARRVYAEPSMAARTAPTVLQCMRPGR